MTQNVDAITREFLSDYEKNNKDKFKTTLEYVRKVFFPRWDRKEQWRLRQVDDLPSYMYGVCESKEKMIKIHLDKFVVDYNKSHAARESDCLLSLLIHEVCHSSRPDHGKAWQTRMERRSEIAKRVGLSTLSTMLEEDVALQRCLSGLRARNIYDEIKERVWSNRTAAYDEVIKFVAWRNGLEGHSDALEAMFKACKKVFKEAKKNSKAYWDKKLHSS